MNNPRSVALDPGGNLYVADTGNSRIVKFDSSGRELGQIGKRGTEPGEFSEPWIVAVSAKAEILVLDRESAWIQVFTPDGELIRRFGGPKAGFYHAGGMAVGPDGTVIVADTGGDRIVLFDADGQYVKSISVLGKTKLRQPTDVLVDPQGGLYVLQPSLEPGAPSFLLHLTARGDYQSAWRVVRAPSTRDSPRGALDSKGRLFLTDPTASRVHVYAAGFKESHPIALEGPETTTLKSITGLAVGKDGRFYVVDASAGVIYGLQLAA